MTIAQAIKFASAKLRAKNINNPPLEAEILLSSILKKPREFILTHGEILLSKKQITKYQQLLKRRLKDEPIAYLTGHKEFYGLNFIVNKNVLIPRPETELLVEEALKLATHSSSGFVSLRKRSGVAMTRSGEARQPVTLVDVGTGSGCIIITLAKILNQKSQIINHELWGIDISAKALTIAKQNARAHQVNKKIKFIHGNLLEPILNSKFQIPNSKFLILANLPYGWAAWKNNTTADTIGLKFEPKIALFASKNSLGLYEQLFKQIKALRVVSYELRDICVLCEFDPRQTAKIKKLIQRELPRARLQIKKDLSDLNRLAIITL